MGIATEASLILATLQLQQVSLLRDAIRTADTQSGKAIGAAGIAVNPQPRFQPRDVFHPEPRFEPRVVYHPTPRYEARRVLHPTEKVEPDTLLMSSGPGEKCHESSALQPPWKVLPWPQKVHSTTKIKAIISPPDTNHKGTLIDFFI